MSSVMDLAMRNSQALGVVLSSRVVNPAVTLLQGATGYWDVANYTSGSQTLPNRGTGGTALDARLGSTSGVDSNDPQFLPYSDTPYVYLPGVAGNYLSVPDAAALDVTGDIDIRVDVALPTWTPAASSALLAKYATGTNQRTYKLLVTATGALQFVASASGTAADYNVTSSATVGFAASTRSWCRATRNATSGDVKFYTSPDGTTWTQLGTTQSTAAGSMFSSSAILELGSSNSGTSELLTGNIYRAQVLDGIGGSTVLDVDTSVLTSGSAASFTATTGQTVTINRSSSGRKAVAVVKPVMLFGTDDYLTVADNDLLDFGATEPMTAVIVARQWATPTSSGRLMSKWNGTASAGWMILDAATAVTPYGYVRDATHVVDTSAVAAAGSSGTAALAGFVVDRTAQTVASFNGATISNTVSISAVGLLSNSYEMQIGRDGTATYQNFEFLFAAVFRRALSASEISILATYAASRMP